MEKRSCDRIKIPVEVIYKKNRKKIKADCLDISGGGLCLVTGEPLSAGDEIEASVYAGEEEAAFAVKVYVVRVKKEKGGTFRNGLKFTKIKHKDDFIQFICDKLLSINLTEDDGGAAKKGG